MSVILKPHRILKTGQGESRFYLADCLDVFKQLEPRSVDVIVTSPPYNIGIQYSRYQDALSAAEYLAWTDTWMAAATRVLRAGRIAVPQRRGQAERPLDRARRRAGGARAPQAAEHHPLGQVDRDRPRVGRRRRRSDARPGGRPLQADQQRPLPERLPRVHLSPDAERIDQPRSPRARRALSGSVEHRPLAQRVGRAFAAAATRGSSRTKRSSSATATGRIRPRFRRACPSSVCGSTGWTGFRWRWIPSRGSAARPSPARASA